MCSLLRVKAGTVGARRAKLLGPLVQSTSGREELVEE